MRRSDLLDPTAYLDTALLDSGAISADAPLTVWPWFRMGAPPDLPPWL
jgi:hypothetical protein